MVYMLALALAIGGILGGMQLVCESFLTYLDFVVKTPNFTACLPCLSDVISYNNNSTTMVKAE